MNHPTAPRVRRTPMRPAPWFGLGRGLLFALWPGMRFEAPQAPEAAAWPAVARARRRALLALVGLLAATALAVQWNGRPDSLSATWWGYTAMLTLLMAWVGAGFATALMGAWVLWRGDPHAMTPSDDHRPIHRDARTAVIMPICNEDIATVFGGLRATCESVAATGALNLFDFYVLSDTADPALRAAEMRAWERLREMMGDDPTLAGGRVFYRWRRRRVKRKAGNVADFCRRWGGDYRYMVVLDADSTMRGDTLVSLVRLMEQHPRAGIIQTLPQPCGHGTLHARAQQFAHRVTGRLFSLGMAFWQLGDSHYWGHNAIIRVAPFMQHCALAPLPGRGGLSGEILSHDFVEAAMMARAGFEVWLVPTLGGSWEQNPPHLLDELQRDRRWCQGNMQNARLVAEPGWRPVHRVMFATAAFSYGVAPMWLLFMLLGAAGGASHAPSLWLLTLALLLLPRVLGIGAVIVKGEQQAFGGSLRLMAGGVAEALVSALQAPVRMLAHSLFVISALTGLKLVWKSPSRQAEGLAWRDALSRLGPLTFPALAGAALLLGPAVASSPAWWPVLLPLLLAVPQAVASASPRLGMWAERAGLMWNPEARRPPRTLARASENRSFADLMPPPRIAPAAVTAIAARPRLALALGVMAVASLMAMPRTGLTPELPAHVRQEQQWMAAVLQAQSLAAAQAERLAAARSVARSRPTVSEPPARTIDDALRERALQAVERALQEEADKAALLLESA